MKVLIDGRMLLGRFSGVARVVTALVEHLVRRDDLRVAVLCGDEPYAPWRSRNNIEMVVTDFSRAHRSPLRRLMWESTRLSRWVERSGADVFHATWNSGVPRRCPVPTVLTIHDLIAPPLGWNTLRSALEMKAQGLSVARSAAHATLVTTVSAHSRQQVLQALGVSPQRVRIVHNGVAADLNISRVQHEERGPSYLLYVGGFEKRKNLPGLFAAVERYWLAHGPVVELWLTGNRERLPGFAADALDRAERCGTVRFLGEVSDAELSGLYSSAAALLLLSLEEGFGLPVLEAMACGCPVVASDRASLPEIAGDAAQLVDPLQPECVARSVGRILENTEFRAGMIRRGLERARLFTWPATAAGYAEAYTIAAACCTGASRRRDHLAEKKRASVPSGPIGSAI